jgi:hypothetical protein
MQPIELKPGTVLSGDAWTSLRLMRDTVSGCLFESVNCDDFRAWATTFEKCVFRKSSFRVANFGGWLDEGKRSRGNRFIDCTFDNVNMSQSSFDGATLEGCTFTNITKGVLIIRGSIVDQCVFSGRLPEAEFFSKDPSQTCPQIGVFRNTQFVDCQMPFGEMVDMDAGGCRIERSPRLRKLRRPDLAKQKLIECCRQSPDEVTRRYEAVFKTYDKVREHPDRTLIMDITVFDDIPDEQCRRYALSVIEEHSIA